MTPDKSFLNLPTFFWSHIRLIGQISGYSEYGTNHVKSHTREEIIHSMHSLDLNVEVLNRPLQNGLTLGDTIEDYLKFRADLLNDKVQASLMMADEAQAIFENIQKKYNPTCPLPVNKQRLGRGRHHYFTCIINTLIQHYSNNHECNYNPGELSFFTKNKSPVGMMSRRMDGAYPSTKNPIAVWEIKEYYFTSTFGSRVSDGVYETQLDGLELKEIKNSESVEVLHYFFIDAYDTWWLKGRSYLCRIIDMLHMNYLDEVIFGKEVIERIPLLIDIWNHKLEHRDT